MESITDPIKDVYIVKADSADTVMHTGDLIETTLKSYTIPGGTICTNGSIRIKATGVSRGNGGNKIYRLRLDGIEIGQFVVSAGVVDRPWFLDAACHNLFAENSQVWSYLWTGQLFNDFMNTQIMTAIDTSIDKILAITGRIITDISDEIEIRELTIEIRPAG